MGFAANQDAFTTLDKLDAYCRKQGGGANVWTYKEKTYFYDLSRRDQPDGGLCGTVAVFLPDNMCRTVGGFKIDGNGAVIRFPGWPTADLPKPEKTKAFRW